MNNNQAKDSIQTILEKLEDQLGLSKATRDKIAREEFNNFEYVGSTSNIMDKMERLRKKLHSTVTSNTKTKMQK